MRDETMEKYYDVLQNIEFAIWCVYTDDATLLDLEVMDGLDLLVRRYVAEEQGRTPPRLRGSERAQRVYADAERMCEWRLGRGRLNVDSDEPLVAEGNSSITDILICLKRIRKSVRLWNEQGGRQGYLEYIDHFFEQAQRRQADRSRLGSGRVVEVDDVAQNVMPRVD
jgi:hypothetical protein